MFRRTKYTVSVFAAALLATGAAIQHQTGGEPEPPASFRQWGEETLEAIERDLWIPERGLYAEEANVKEGGPAGPAFMWGAGVQLSALAAAAQVDPQRYTAPMRAYADVLQTYWNVHDGIGGYDVLPGPKPPDRYYDDNVWVVLALAEIFEVTEDPVYLERAEATFRFVLSGEDDKLGGGIYWHENTRDSKNTCSNAPSIVAALRLYELTQEPHHLETAHRLYDWTNERLQDEDGLFWDNIKLDGEIDERKYSYNSALMIRANSLFYALTGNAEYLAEAQRIARAAEAQWVAPETGGVSDEGRFAHLLTESFLALHEQDGDDHWLEVVRDALRFVHEDVRDPNGRYPNRWDRPRSTALERVTLLDQASPARAYFMAEVHGVTKYD